MGLGKGLLGAITTGLGGALTAVGIEGIVVNNLFREAYLAHAPQINQTVMEQSGSGSGGIGASILLIGMGVGVMSLGYYMIRDVLNYK